MKVDDKQLAAFLEDEGPAASRRRRLRGLDGALRARPRDCSPTLDAITLAAFRDALGVGRRTAQLLLERYDADGLTLRRGDVRVLRRAHR